MIVGGDEGDPGLALVSEISPAAYTLIADLAGTVVTEVAPR